MTSISQEEEMLILSRKIDEEIVIGDQVILKVIQIRGRTVRLGIAAPRHVNIARAEVQQVPIESEGELELELSSLSARNAGLNPG